MLEFNSFSIHFIVFISFVPATVGAALFVVEQMLILNKSLSCKQQSSLL